MDCAISAAGSQRSVTVCVIDVSLAISHPFRIADKRDFLKNQHGSYRQREKALLNEPSEVSHDVTSKLSLKLLQADPDARLVIHLHETAGTNSISMENCQLSSSIFVCT